jgi:hypothetical protein
MDIPSWTYIYIYIYIYIYFISFIFKLINCLKNPTNIEELEHMEYICDKINHYAKTW